MSTRAALPRLHRAGLAVVAGAVLAVTTAAAVSAAFAGASGHRPTPHPDRGHHSRGAEPGRSADPSPRASNAPVSVASADWRCNPPADEKFVCSLGETSVVVTWRKAAERGEYLGIARAGDVIFVSDVHGRFFATVMGGPETSQSQVDQVGALLAWR